MSGVAFLVGETVDEVRHDSRVVFRSGEKPEPTLYADVGECVVVDAAGEPVPLSFLVGRTVNSASTKDAVLTLEFRDGAGLRCEPDAKYEAWQVVGGSPQYLVVCLPGGELAVWDERHVPSPDEATEMAQKVLGQRARVREITDQGGIVVDVDDDTSEI